MGDSVKHSLPFPRTYSLEIFMHGERLSIFSAFRSFDATSRSIQPMIKSSPYAETVRGSNSTSCR